jgi:hypothetical protein
MKRKKRRKKMNPRVVEVLVRDFQYQPILVNGQDAVPVTTMKIYHNEFHYVVSTPTGVIHIAKDKQEDYGCVLVEGDIIVSDQTKYADPEPPAVYVPQAMQLYTAQIAYHHEPPASAGITAIYLVTTSITIFEFYW